MLSEISQSHKETNVGFHIHEMPRIAESQRHKVEQRFPGGGESGGRKEYCVMDMEFTLRMMKRFWV